MYLHSELTEKIIGCSYEVAKHLGYGLMEIDYAKALCIEFEALGIKYQLEKSVDLSYKNTKLDTKRLDFMVEDAVVVELKVQEFITNSAIQQVVSYLKATQKRIGLIVCFAKTGVKIKRVIK